MGKGDKNEEMRANKHGLPEMFRGLMWSYKFEEIDPEEHYHELIVNTINYGDLKHWRWLIQRYGKGYLREVLTTLPITEFRPRIVKLMMLLFGIEYDEFNYVPRGAH